MVPYCQIEYVSSDSDVGMPGQAGAIRRNCIAFWARLQWAQKRWLQMKSSWQIEAGHLACRWSEVGQHVKYNPPWIQEASNSPASYLPPVPDYASHSPFGGARGASWFLRYAPEQDSE